MKGEEGRLSRARDLASPRLVAGLLLILLGIVINRHAFNTWGHDFAQHYISAWLLREGKNVYNHQLQVDAYMRYVGGVQSWGHFYTPGAAVLALPSTIFPYPVIRESWFWIATAVTIGALGWFMAAYIPAWDRPTRVLVIGLILCAASTRWAFKTAQPATMILGLFGVFLAELKAGRKWSAFLAGALVGATKVTFALPFVLMGLAQRRIGIVAAMVAFWAALNVIGIYGMGGPSILVDYRANMAEFERPDQLNYPDPRGFNSLARTDWPYILNAVDPDFSRNNAIGALLSLICLGWLTYEVIRHKERLHDDDATMALSASVLAISMLAVYHHHYDIGLLLLPVLAFTGRKAFHSIRAAWVYSVPVVLYAGFFPYEKASKLADWLVGPLSVLFVKPLGCFVCIVALGASFVILRTVLSRKPAVSDSPAPVPGGLPETSAHSIGSS
jgi:hypothetical protein